MGILTTDRVQVIFMDTPGVHKPLHKLGKFMNDEALAVLTDADVILWLVDAARPPHTEDRILADSLAAVRELPPVILVVNKIDQVSMEQIGQRQQAYHQLYEKSIPVSISALSGAGCRELLDEIERQLPEGPLYYEEDQITDLYEREIAVDLIRESALHHLRDEVPHSMAVRIDTYKDRGEEAAYIAATLFVERNTHKGIVIGKGGSMLKKIGSYARKEIEAMTDRKVFLELRVKVGKNWRNDPDLLRQFGYVARKPQ